MAQVRFLVDESLPKRLLVAVMHRSAAIDILRVGQPGAPPFEKVASRYFCSLSNPP